MLVLFLAIILNFVGRLSSEKTGGKAKIFGMSPTLVMSGSMLPTIDVYSLNLMKSVDIENVVVGDIVVYWNSDRKINIIHRVIDITYENDEKTLWTKGDNNSAADNYPITSDNLVAKVVLIMNWTAPIMEHVIYADGSGIDYAKLSIYCAIIGIGIWLALMIMIAIIRLLISAVKRRSIKDRSDNLEQIVETTEDAELELESQDINNIKEECISTEDNINNKEENENGIQ
jgi:signal peptidase